ncbi:MAG: hypothetical protein MUD16_07715 [Desulfobacterales bacterium]|nr:hypothetical protein [Desulfobacterales bacterium]
MAFVKIPGVRGIVYVPEPCAERSKKHACRDCFDCQYCSAERCSLCREKTSAVCPREKGRRPEE